MGWLAAWPARDCLVVLGGDGTFLRAARALATVDVPVLGVNSGHVGFLSKVDAVALESALAALVARRIRVRAACCSRHAVWRHLGGQWPFAALNDAAIVRGGQVRVLNLEVLVDGTHLATWLADGVVVATPTGSTAYSFSAGGPILDPTARNLVVTPIAAYLASIRSIVVSPRHTVSRARRRLAMTACVASTGATTTRSSRASEVEIRALDRPLRFIEPPGALPFWELLRQKAALLPG